MIFAEPMAAVGKKLAAIEAGLEVLCKEYGPGLVVMATVSGYAHANGLAPESPTPAEAEAWLKTSPEVKRDAFNDAVRAFMETYYAALQRAAGTLAS